MTPSCLFQDQGLKKAKVRVPPVTLTLVRIVDGFNICTPCNGFTFTSSLNLYICLTIVGSSPSNWSHVQNEVHFFFNLKTQISRCCHSASRFYLQNVTQGIKQFRGIVFFCISCILCRTALLPCSLCSPSHSTLFIKSERLAVDDGLSALHVPGGILSVSASRVCGNLSSLLFYIGV